MTRSNTAHSLCLRWIGVAFVLTGGAYLQTPVQAELKISSGAALLELSPSEARLFSAQHIISVCSVALKNNELDQTSRAKLLQFRGDAFFRTANTAAARSDFESVLELLPDDPLARWNLARCLGKQGDVRRAIRECDRVLATTPDFTLAYATKSAAYFAQGDMTSSFKMSSAAVDADADCVYARYLRAIGYLQRREFARCVDDLNVAIRTNLFDPLVKPAGLYSVRGEALYRLGDIRRAKRDFYTALKFDQQHAQALRSLWQIAWKERKYSLSVSLAERLNQIAPDRVSTLRICGMAFGKVRRYEKAAKCAENWTSRKPSDPNAHHLLGVIRSYQGREGEAVKHYRKALELKPTHANTLASISLLLATADDATIKNPAKAKKYASELKRALPRQTPALVVVLSIVHAANDDFAQATRLIEQFLKRDDVDAGRREQCESLLRRFRNRKPILAREHARELF